MPSRMARSQEGGQRREAEREARRRPGEARADDGVRTRDPQLGKLMLYQLSYVRVRLNDSGIVAE